MVYDMNTERTGMFDFSGKADIERLDHLIHKNDFNHLILSGSMLFDSPLSLKKPVTLTGQGCIIKTSGNDHAVTLESDGCAVENITFFGTGKNSGSDISGIHVKETLENSIINCTFSSFSGAGIRLSRAVGSHQGNHITGCWFKDSNVGIEVLERAEYTLITGCTFFRNQKALYISGGNTNMSACVISDNAVGIHIDSGDNHAHGVLGGCSLNHNDIPLFVTDVNYGYNITGCLFYCGDIRISSSRHIKLSSCDFSGIDFHITNSDNCIIMNSHMIEKTDEAGAAVNSNRFLCDRSVLKIAGCFDSPLISDTGGCLVL